MLSFAANSLFLGVRLCLFFGGVASVFFSGVASVFFLVRKQQSRTRGALVGPHPAQFQARYTGCGGRFTPIRIYDSDLGFFLIGVSFWVYSFRIGLGLLLLGFRGPFALLGIGPPFIKDWTFFR